MTPDAQELVAAVLSEDRFARLWAIARLLWAVESDARTVSLSLLGVQQRLKLTDARDIAAVMETSDQLVARYLSMGNEFVETAARQPIVNEAPAEMPLLH